MQLFKFPLFQRTRRKVMARIDIDRSTLYEQSLRITKQQQQILEHAASAVAQLGKEHEGLLLQIAELDQEQREVVAG